MKKNFVTIAFCIALICPILQPNRALAQDTLDQKPAPLPPVVVVTSTASGSAFGGQGGGPFESACPTNYVMTGISDSNYVAATNWYNVGLAITCRLVSTSSSGTLKLETTSVKKAVFTFSSFTANMDSICSNGNAITELRVYANYTGFVQDVGANCKSFVNQSNSETIPAANSPIWDNQTNYLSSCTSGSFAIGVYGRNGQGIDQLGVRCGVFSASFPKPYVFESAFPMDLIPIQSSSLSKADDLITCSAGTFGYQYVGMTLKDVQRAELDSTTLLLKIDGIVVGASSSDNFKNLPQWILNIDSKALIATYANNSATWKVPGVSNFAKISCQIMAFKDHQMTYITIP